MQQPLMEQQQNFDVILHVPDLNRYFMRFYYIHLLREKSWFAIVIITGEIRLVNVKFYGIYHCKYTSIQFFYLICVELDICG